MAEVFLLNQVGYVVHMANQSGDALKKLSIFFYSAFFKMAALKNLILEISTIQAVK